MPKCPAAMLEKYVNVLDIYSVSSELNRNNILFVLSSQSSLTNDLDVDCHGRFYM